MLGALPKINAAIMNETNNQMFVGISSITVFVAVIVLLLVCVLVLWFCLVVAVNVDRCDGVRGCGCGRGSPYAVLVSRMVRVSLIVVYDDECIAVFPCWS